MFVGELEVLEDQPLLARRDQVLVDQSFAELLLVLPELIGVEVELVIGGNVGRW